MSLNRSRRFRVAAPWQRVGLAVVSGLLSTAHALAEDALTEDDYFASLPVVLTVSRLTQPISDTPGAVTIIDRQTIRRLGARDLADVLRLVPGYLVSGYNGAHQIGAYHAPIDEYGTRNLVLVDGRSIYSSTYLGGTMRGVSSIRLEDVERIEVLRGSNSAAYGANALFGVINVITRHSVDTMGGEVAVNKGNRDLGDAYARWGWGTPDASYRISVGQRQDSGYGSINDSRRLNNVLFRSDRRLDASSSLTLDAGHTSLTAGEGFPRSYGNPIREIHWNNSFVKAKLEREFSERDSSKLNVSWDRDRTEDVYPFLDPNAPAIYYGAIVDAGAVEQRWNVEYQHEHVASDSLRWVLGVGYKRDSARSRPLFGTNDTVDTSDMRVFGNLEWRPSSAWTLNAGLFSGKNSDTGGYASPRVALNYHLTDDHTLRFSASKALRQPTLFENQGNRRFYSVTGALLVTPSDYVAAGSLKPEKLNVVEWGYHGHWRDLRLTGDLRLFRERMTDYIELGGVTSANSPQGFQVRGMEYQLQWVPWDGASVWWSESLLDFEWGTARVSPFPPKRLSSLTWFQRLGSQWDMALSIHSRDAMSWRTSGFNHMDPATRVDLRVSRQFNLGSSRAEAALTLQALNGDQQAFVPSRLFQRRAFATLRLEF